MHAHRRQLSRLCCVSQTAMTPVARNRIHSVLRWAIVIFVTVLITYLFLVGVYFLKVAPVVNDFSDTLK